MKNRILLILITFMLAVSIVGCKKKKTTIDSKKEQDAASQKKNEEEFKNNALEIIKKYKVIQKENEENPDKKVILAKVGDEEVLKSDIDFVMESRYIGKDNLPDEETQKKERDVILENMIQKAGAISYAKKNGLYPSDEDINEALAKLKETINSDEYETKKAEEVMKKTGWNMDQYVESYRKDIAETFAVDSIFKDYKRKYPTKEDQKYTFQNFLDEIMSGEQVERFDK